MQEAQVVAGDQPDVVDAIAQHGDPLDAQPESEAAILVGIVANIAQHARINLAGATHLEPAAVLADAAAGATADDAVYVELGAGLREREVARAEANLAAGAEELAGEALQRATQMRHRGGLIDQQPLHLVEDRFVTGVGRFVTIDLSRHDRTHGRLHLLHDANLIRRGLRAQKDLPWRDPERILHVARGVIQRHIERLEVVVIRLDLRPLDDLASHAAEDAGDLAGGQRERVEVPTRSRPPRQRYVETLALQRRAALRQAELGAPRLEQRL